MAITQKTIKLLWAGAAGTCSFTGCGERLCDSGAAGSAPYTIGEMAHIRGELPGSNRHDESQTPQERDDYLNLILLCPTHHALVDRKENESTYTVDRLIAMKIEHERLVLHRMIIGSRLKFDIARIILVGLTENEVVWRQYGPASDIAKRNPNDDRLFSIWQSERLSVIAPNNRKIAATLEENRGLFAPDEQLEISAFAAHARSYESWINDDIPYNAVIRYPLSFEKMIRSIANAGQ